MRGREEEDGTETFVTLQDVGKMRSFRSIELFLYCNRKVELFSQCVIKRLSQAKVQLHVSRFTFQNGARLQKYQTF